MFLQDQSLHVLQQLTDEVDVAVDQLKALDIGRGGSCVGQSGLPPLLHPCPRRQLSCSCAQGCDQLSHEGWCQLFHWGGW